MATLNIISIPSGADIFIDNRFEGTTDKSLEITPGTYKIALEKEGFITNVILNFTITSQDLTKTHRVVLETGASTGSGGTTDDDKEDEEASQAGAGFLEMSSIPTGARMLIQIEGRWFIVTGKTEFKVGTYNVRAEFVIDKIVKAGDRQDKIIEIEENKITKVVFNFEEEEPTLDTDTDTIKLPEGWRLADDVSATERATTPAGAFVKLPDGRLAIMPESERQSLSILGAAFIGSITGVAVAIGTAGLGIWAILTGTSATTGGAAAGSAIITPKGAVGAVGSVLGIDTLMVWLAEDNVLTGLGFTIRKLRDAVAAGIKTESEVNAIVKKVLAWQDTAAGVVRTSTDLNPFLLPFKGILLANIEKSKVDVDLELDLMDELFKRMDDPLLTRGIIRAWNNAEQINWLEEHDITPSEFGYKRVEQIFKAQ